MTRRQKLLTREGKACFDRHLPKDLLKPTVPTTLQEGLDRAVFLVSKLWATGQTIKIAFMDGGGSQHETVKQESTKWLEHANLNFEWGSINGSNVRISFDENRGSWSYVGKDCLGIPADQPTMNLAWLDGGVILHEFGHALGMAHEHQNPRGKQINWNKQVVNAALSGPPNYWSQATIDFNLYERYALNQTNGSETDPKSIMMYSFPKEWTMDGFSASDNIVLSQLDIGWARRVYPGKLVPTLDIPLPILPAPMQGEIGKRGEEDRYTFSVTVPGTHVIQTLGPTDTVLTVLDVTGRVLGTDDDSGESHNSKISLNLVPGVYKVVVRHYSTGMGKYGIQVQRA